jgi:hypothetical protein
MRFPRTFWALFGLCYVLALVLYAHVLRAFLIWDDVAILPWIAPAGWRGWLNCFTPTDVGFIRPATLLAFKVCYVVAGTAPLLYHLVAVGVHAAAAAMTGLIAARLLPARSWMGLLAAVMMTTHFGAFPCASMLCNSCDSFAGLGIMVAVYWWDRWLMAPAGEETLWPVSMGFVLALAGKELAVLTPVVLGLWAVGRGVVSRRSGRAVLWYGLAAGLVGALVLWLQVTAKISYVNAGDVAGSGDGLLKRFFNLVANTYLPYLSVLQWPVGKVVTSTLLLRVCRRLALVLLVVCAAVVCRRGGRYRVAAACVLCGAVVLLPVVPIRGALAPRYLYCALPFSVLALLAAVAQVPARVRMVAVVLLVQLWATYVYSVRSSPVPRRYLAATRAWSKFVKSVGEEKAKWKPGSTVSVFTNFAHGGRKYVPTTYGQVLLRVFYPKLLIEYQNNKLLPRTKYIYRFDGHKLVLVDDDAETSGSELD